MPILFDLDDTLLDDRGAQEIYLAQLYEMYQGDLPYTSRTAFHAAWRSAIDRHFARYLQGEVTMEQQRRDRVRDVFEQPNMADSNADAIIASFLTAYEAAWRLFPDVLQTLDVLKGTVLGIITNGSQEQQLKKLRATGILDRFSVVVVSESVGHAKPSPQIFEHACAQLGCAAEDCVFIGDDWDRDIVGSSAAHMTPIWLNHAARAAERPGVISINSLVELIERADVQSALARARGAAVIASRESVKIRKASLADVPAIEPLIALSARALGAHDYTVEQIEAALLGAWGVDTELIRDGTYFVGETADQLVLCGGWSRRATSFGGDAYERRESRLLDPQREAARIRAFFVHPQWARQGLASQLLALCEDEARVEGFATAELVATLPGEKLYARHGYVSGGRRSYALPGGGAIDFISMHRRLVAPTAQHDGARVLRRTCT